MTRMTRLLSVMLPLFMSIGSQAQWIGTAGTAATAGTTATLPSCANAGLVAGAAWTDLHPDFTQPFTVTFRALFSTAANGGDGIAMVIKSGARGCSPCDPQNLTVNATAGHLGYYQPVGGVQASGFEHSLAVELDIFTNGGGPFNDPAFDHFSFAQNGLIPTATSFPATNSFQIDPASPTVNDGLYHTYRVDWNCADSSLSVFFDGNLRAQMTGFNVSGITSPMLGFTGGKGVNCVNQQLVDSVSLIHHPESSCLGLAGTDTRYWRVIGNNITNGNNIFGTLTKDDVKIQTSATDRGIFTFEGLLGWNTMSPTAYLHVNCKDHNKDEGYVQSDVRFENLEPGRGTLLVIDEKGYVYNSKDVYTPTTGISNSCSTINMMPKVATAGGNLGCSQVFDNGTTVGINKTTGFTYTWSGGLTGTTMPPASGNVRLDVNGVTRALAFMATSDERFKSDIQPIKNPFSIINSLQGKTYYWNEDVRKSAAADDGRQYGFIAQEVKKVMPDAVITDENGYYAINYNDFIPLLVESNKELYQQNQKLEAELAAIRSMLGELSTCCAKKDNEKSTATVKDNASSKLFQNTPNPYSEKTEIGYLVAGMKTAAFITINDLNGRQLRRYAISQAGSGNVEVNGSDLMSGIYIYSLIVDGQEIDSKRMILMK